MARNVQDLRNLALCGHGSAGKTTLADTLLVSTGASSGQHSVDDGSSLCDFDEEEKKHKYTIEAKVTHFDHGGKRFNLIDTPGYPDYIGQVIGALRGVDNAAIVIDAHAGIAVNTRRVFNLAGKEGLGRIIIINKMDGENIDFPALIADIQELWGPACVPLNVPIGHGADFKGVASTLSVPADTAGALLDPAEISEPLLESIVSVDEKVMERYLEGEPPQQDELARLLVRAVAEGDLVPILCCSGKTQVGVPELLDALVQCTLSPADFKRTAKNEAGEEVVIEPDPAGLLIAQVFKTRIDPFVQKLSFIRLFSGTLHDGDTVHASSARKGVKLAQLLEPQAAETHHVTSAGAGEIVAVAKVEDLHTGSSLGDFTLPPIPFPTPMVGLAVLPKSHGDESKLSTSLHKIEEEDPTLHLHIDSQTKELVMTGMSELHLQIVRERLARRDHVEVETKQPKIPFRETITAPAEGMYRHKKQTGGRGQFGEVHIRMMPLPRDVNVEEFCSKERFPQLKAYHYDEKNNFLWVDSIVGGVIPGNFMPAIEKGFKERLARGVIAGHQVQDVCVEVHFGKHHPVDSSEAAFKTAGSMAFREVFQKAHPCLLEPIVSMAVTVPEANVGDVYSDMSGRGGRVQGSESAGGGMQTVHAEVPLREATTYNRALSSMTGGQGSFSMEFSHYDVMPANIQQQVQAKAELHEEEDS